MVKKVVSSDILQKGYFYNLTEPVGINFDPKFKPQLTPKEMLELGIFGGQYFYGGEKEYPEEWFKNIVINKNPDPSLNFFEINASQSLQTWEQKGWINPEDPRGWVQWYLRYYLGRRLGDEDQRQIKRWLAAKRHIAQLQKNCQIGDWSCRRRQRQALLHWAYDSRKL